jgi:hypothetical protein
VCRMVHPGKEGSRKRCGAVGPAQRWEIGEESGKMSFSKEKTDSGRAHTSSAMVSELWGERE